MADESLHTVPLEHNIDFHIVTLFERLEAIRKESNGHSVLSNRFSSAAIHRRSMHAEIRTLEFWRSIISECLASFFYVFIVCGAAAGAGVGASVSSVLLATALASGLAMATLTHCFLHISGAHINPAVTIAACVIRVISPMRASMYVTAQCGGGIAGAALLYGVTVPGYQGNLQAAISQSATLAAWERFGVEIILTMIVVLSYFVSTDPFKKMMGNSAISIGTAYSACSFVSMPYLNPARSLGPSFVLNKWENHWVYWFGPLVGGICSAIIFEFIFNRRRGDRHSATSIENESSSIHSEDELNYELDMDKINSQIKFQGTNPRSGPTIGQSANSNAGNFNQNLYTEPPPLSKLEKPEPIYGGTRSMYCQSPILTRTSLNRSQSVYAKSNTAINRDILPCAGPLVPAQSLYPMRLLPTQQTQSSHLQNQNVQNQLQQHSEATYGIRSSSKQSQQFQQQPLLHHNQQQHLNYQQQPQIQPNHYEQHQKQRKLQRLTPLQMQHQQQQQEQQKQQQAQKQPQMQQAYQLQQPQAVSASQTNTSQEHQKGFQSIYGTRLNPTSIDGNIKYVRRAESVYGYTTQRNHGQSAQSDDSSYGSYHDSSNTARIGTGEPINVCAPNTNPQHGNTLGTSQRTQSERKATAPVVLGPQQKQAPLSAMSGTVTYPANKHTNQQQQQNLSQPQQQDHERTDQQPQHHHSQMANFY